jgi:hypothetical protein
LLRFSDKGAVRLVDGAHRAASSCGGFIEG